MSKRRGTDAAVGKKPLPDARQEAFCVAYGTAQPRISASEAARRAGYSPKTCREQASALLSKPHIGRRVEFLTSQVSEAAVISVQRRKEMCSESALARFARERDGVDAPDFLPCIKELNSMEGVYPKDKATADFFEALKGANGITFRTDIAVPDDNKAAKRKEQRS